VTHTLRQWENALIDHVVYAAPELEHAIAEFSAEYGVSPIPGGRHLRYGTRNALVGLGASTYLELVGIDRQQDVPARERLFALDATSTPRYVTWCARASRPLAQTVAIARAAGLELGEIVPMSRARPDGSIIAWSMTSPLADRAGGVLPFFIDWGTTPHPASALAAVLSLASLTAIHPDPDRIRAILDELGERAVCVEAGAEPALRVVLV
jgi:hypothetical protein